MTIRMVAASLFLLCGAFVFAVSVVGLFRFKNTLDRIHASELSDTMGIFCTIVGLIILSDNFFSAAKLSLVVIFIWLTSPVAAHLIGKIEILTAGENYKNRRDIK